MFVADALVMSPNMPSFQGRAALLEFIESAEFAMTRHSIEFPEIGGYGDIAYARGTYDEAFTMGGAEELVEDAGKILAILRKQPDGSWLITHWITNSDLPLPPAEGEHSEEGEHG
jgi:ketosteroid isomerase-like protein